MNEYKLVGDKLLINKSQFLKEISVNPKELNRIFGKKKINKIIKL